MLDGLILTNCGYENCKIGHFFGPAVRDHLLIHYVVSGEGIFHKNKLKYQVKKGQIFVILPGEITFYEADQREPWEYYWVGVRGRELHDYIFDLNLNQASVIDLIDYTEKNINHQKSHNEIIDLLEILMDYFLSSENNPYRIASYLNLFFSKIADANGRYYTTGSGELLEQATEYLNNNYSYDISIESLCKIIGISRAHFFRVFKKHTGISPQNYLVKTRINAACRLLLQSQLGVTEIAFSCGFKDSAHFSRIFKSYIGLPPKDYRKSKRNTS